MSTTLTRATARVSAGMWLRSDIGAGSDSQFLGQSLQAEPADGGKSRQGTDPFCLEQFDLVDQPQKLGALLFAQPGFSSARWAKNRVGRCSKPYADTWGGRGL